MNRPDRYTLDVPDPPAPSADPTRGAVQSVYGLTRLGIEMGAFTGTIRVMGTRGGTEFVTLQEVNGGADPVTFNLDGIYYALAVDVVALTGDKPTVTVIGHLE